MKRIIILASLMFSLSTLNAYALCKGSMINPITEVRWTCMFPISLGGISPTAIPVPDAATAIIADKMSIGAISPMCMCGDPVPRVGLTFSMNNVFRIVESVKDPFCFPTLGMSIGAGPFGTAGQYTGVKRASATTFNYTHMITFVPTQILNLFIDVLCLQLSEVYSPLSVIGLSEFEPWARSSELALLIAPETILFANPIAQAYCMVDAVLTLAELTDPIGYWCAGSNTIFPMSNHTTESEYVDAASINAAKYLFKLARTGQLLSCYGAQAMCFCVPNPIWNKMEYRLQIAKPIPDSFCRRIGKPSLTWNVPNKNPSLVPNTDNLLFLIWRHRDCCVL